MRAHGRHLELRSERSGRNPFQLWVVAAATLTGVIALLPLQQSSSGVVDRYLPGWATTLWYVGLVVGGLLVLCGTFVPARTVPRLAKLLGVEQVGLALLAALLLSYGLALEVLAPRLPSGLITFALGVASVTRWRQLTRERRRLYDLVESLVEHQRDGRSTTD